MAQGLQDPADARSRLAQGTLKNTWKLQQNSIPRHMTHKIHLVRGSLQAKQFSFLSIIWVPAFLPSGVKKGFLKRTQKPKKKKKVIYMKTLKLGTCVRQLQERKDKEEHPIATHTISSRLVSRSCQHVQGEVSIAQSCLALCDPMDCSPPGSSVCGILQARTLEWVPFPSPGESS